MMHHPSVPARFVTLFTLLMLLSGCGSGLSPSELHDGPQRGVILIGMGGYLSCPDGNLYGSTHFSKMQDIEGAVRAQGRDVKKIFSCYDSSWADPNGLIIHFAMPDGQQRNENIWSYMDKVTNEINANPSYDVYIIGHSHGGWLALKLLNDKWFNRPIKGYFSVDPISRIECSPARFTQNTWSKLNPAQNACLRFPYDVGDLGFIRSKLGFWKNFYQENSPNLHSSWAPNAENIRKDYGWDGGYDFYNSAHIKVWTDWGVWGDLKYLILSGY